VKIPTSLSPTGVTLRSQVLYRDRLRNRGVTKKTVCNCCSNDGSTNSCSQSENSTYEASLSEAMMSIIEEPDSYINAMRSKDKIQWKKAMDDEYESLMQNNTWVLTEAPEDQRIIDNKWVFKVKYKVNGAVERYKARLVARGFTQEYAVDYNETFSAVVKFSSIRVILALAASENMKLQQFDIKTVFCMGSWKKTYI
jgi:uncharacterized protein (DUF1330 family)